MASGNTLFDLSPLGSIPTTTNYATQSTISDGSTAVGQVPVLKFPGTTPDTCAEWLVEVPSQYAGGGFTFKPQWATDGTSTGGVGWELRAFKEVSGDNLSTLDLGSKTAALCNASPGGTASVLLNATASLSHANAGSPAPGDVLRVRITRDYDFASNTDNAELVALLATET